MREIAGGVPRHPLHDDLVDWSARLAAEKALLLRVLADARSKRVLDLGCGTGRHARFLASEGFEVVGIDASERALERARSEPAAPGVELLLGDIGAVERAVRGHFGAALCLGNTLPYLLSAESVSRMLVGLKRRLLPGAPVLVHQFNYDRLGAGSGRVLPAQRVPGIEAAGDEAVVVRLVEPQDEGIVVLTTAVLGYRPTAVPPVQLVDSRAEQLRGWTSDELSVLLDVARLTPREVFGGMGEEPFDPVGSPDLVVVAG